MADIIRWDPFREIQDMRDTMDRLFERGFSRPWRLLTWDGGEGFFPVDLYETDDEVVVRASLQGVEPEDVHISVAGDRGKCEASHKLDRRIEGDTAGQRCSDVVIRCAGVFLGRIAAEDLREVFHVHALSVRAAVEAADEQYLAGEHGVEFFWNSGEFRLLGELAFRHFHPESFRQG